MRLMALAAPGEFGLSGAEPMQPTETLGIVARGLQRVKETVDGHSFSPEPRTVGIT